MNPVGKLRHKLFHDGDLWYISSFQGQVINQCNSDISTCRREHESEEASDKDLTAQAAFLAGYESLTCVTKLQVSGLKIPQVLTTCICVYKTFLGSIFDTWKVLCCGLSKEGFSFFSKIMQFVEFFFAFPYWFEEEKLTRNQLNHLYVTSCIAGVFLTLYLVTTPWVPVKVLKEHSCLQLFNVCPIIPKVKPSGRKPLV